MKQILNYGIYLTESKQVFRRKRQGNEFEAKITIKSKIGWNLHIQYSIKSSL